VNINCAFISQKSADAEARNEKPPRATLADVVAHIDHIRQVGGIDAVGIGTDFDGIECTPEGLDDVSKFPNLTRALLEKGYTAEDIRKIYGGNFLRVMRAVEVTAGK
jgi:membrane dipeptidase